METHAACSSAVSPFHHSALSFGFDLEALRKAVLDVSAGWGGEAFSAFQGKSEEWNRHARGIHSALV
ncbi:hypothetical protein ABZ330_36390, partial [Streptomyces sp. NPDC006172]